MLVPLKSNRSPRAYTAQVSYDMRLFSVAYSPLSLLTLYKEVSLYLHCSCCQNRHEYHMLYADLGHHCPISIYYNARINVYMHPAQDKQTLCSDSICNCLILVQGSAAHCSNGLMVKVFMKAEQGWIQVSWPNISTAATPSACRAGYGALAAGHPTLPTHKTSFLLCQLLQTAKRHPGLYAKCGTCHTAPSDRSLGAPVAAEAVPVAEAQLAEVQLLAGCLHEHPPVAARRPICQPGREGGGGGRGGLDQHMSCFSKRYYKAQRPCGTARAMKCV